jgi:translation elongation factor EF-G
MVTGRDQHNLQDGVVIVIDIIDVDFFQVEKLICEMGVAQIVMALYINKLDRCFYELNMNNEEIFEVTLLEMGVFTNKEN